MAGLGKFFSLALAGLLVLSWADAQLWQSAGHTATHPLLQGFKVEPGGKDVFRRGGTTIRLDRAGGLVVGVHTVAATPAEAARGLGIAWDTDADQLRNLAQQLARPDVQIRARQGFQEVADREGTILIAVNLSGSGASSRWQTYSALNAWPESAFPAMKNVRGQGSAPNTLRIYSDFQCPYCRKLWHEVLPRWEAQPQLYRIIHHHFPLDFHKNALPAAEASECAAAQNKFWPYADQLFRAYDAWTPQSGPATTEAFITYAQQLKLNVPVFLDCLKTRPHQAAVKGEVQSGLRVAVSGTPSVFLNGIKLQNYASETELARVRQVTNATPSAQSVIAARLRQLK